MGAGPPPRPGTTSSGGGESPFDLMQGELDIPNMDAALKGSFQLWNIPDHKLGFAVPSPVNASIVKRQGDGYIVKLELDVVNDKKLVRYEKDVERPFFHQGPKEDEIFMSEKELFDHMMKSLEGGGGMGGGMPPMMGGMPPGGGMGAPMGGAPPAPMGAPGGM